MSALTALETQLQNLRDHQEFYARAKAVYEDIPQDTKKALAQKWVSKAKEFSAGKLAGYEREDQEHDSRRVIRLDDALAALQKLEEDLVQTQVLDFAQLMWKKFKTLRRLYEAIFLNWSGFWKVLVEVWQFVNPPSEEELLNGYKQLVGGMAVVASIGVEAFSAKAFLAVALSVAKERDKCIRELRRKALRQPPAKRYRRRKRAR